MFFIYILDGPEEHSSKLLSTPFVEESRDRFKWIAHLEFTQNRDVSDLTWDKVKQPQKLVITYTCM